MLTMIAETMLPEAYFKGGSVVGLSTLAGFLTPARPSRSSRRPWRACEEYLAANKREWKRMF
jgi:hypothetical protein